MTRKDYETIAACIGGALSDTRNDSNTVYDVMRRLHYELQLDNPKFSSEKFTNRVEFWRGCFKDAL